MSGLIPAFGFERVFIAPWTEYPGAFGWMLGMGFLVASTCGLVGTYLIWRRMALVGDAISHSVLPGIALAFLLFRSRGTLAMFGGALAAGMISAVLIEVIHKCSRVKQDAAIGITFSSLFAVGVILISLYAAQVDLDQECVLYGELAFVPLAPPIAIGGWPLGPLPVVRMAAVGLVTVLLIVVGYKELLVSSFDPGLAFSLGINATLVHYAIMGWLSVVVVSAFEAVGAILVIAMLILPGATAALLARRLVAALWLAVLHSATSTVLGLHLAVWLDCSAAGAIVVMGAVLFCLVWLFNPASGLLTTRLRRARLEEPQRRGSDATLGG
jgi:manganese/zinc/iron transport system permease protein